MPVETLTSYELLRKVLWRLLHRYLRSLWRYAKDQGLTMSQLFILRQIHAQTQRGCNISLISARMGVTNAAISQTLDHLVQQGLVSRTEDPQDRRNKRILLTAKGEQFLHQSMEASQSWMIDLIEQLTDDEREAVARAFQLLAEKLEHFD